MHFTIFETPIINTFMRWFSVCMLRLLGWHVAGERPSAPKYVLIGAPHTSNWDFPITLMICFALGLRVYWIGKSSLFPWPVGWLARWLGGISVDRKKTTNMVQNTIDVFNRCERLVVVLAPEGTRGKASHWRSGFYHIAHGAKLPIAMAFLDFKHKTGGIGKMFVPTGDIDQDMLEIQSFYAGITGKNPHRFNADTIKAKTDAD